MANPQFDESRRDFLKKVPGLAAIVLAPTVIGCGTDKNVLETLNPFVDVYSIRVQADSNLPLNHDFMKLRWRVLKAYRINFNYWAGGRSAAIDAHQVLESLAWQKDTEWSEQDLKGNQVEYSTLTTTIINDKGFSRGTQLKLAKMHRLDVFDKQGQLYQIFAPIIRREEMGGVEFVRSDLGPNTFIFTERGKDGSYVTHADQHITTNVPPMNQAIPPINSFEVQSDLSKGYIEYFFRYLIRDGMVWAAEDPSSKNEKLQALMELQKERIDTGRKMLAEYVDMHEKYQRSRIDKEITKLRADLG